MEVLTPEEKIDLSCRIIIWKNELPFVIGKSIRTINRWISEGEFPKPQYKGNSPYYTRKILQEYLNV